MCRSLGFKTSMTSRIVGKGSKGSGHLNYRLRIMGKIEDIPTFMPSKQYSRVVTERNKRSFLDYSFKTLEPTASIDESVDAIMPEEAGEELPEEDVTTTEENVYICLSKFTNCNVFIKCYNLLITNCLLLLDI
jgi:hypothetical protein